MNSRPPLLYNTLCELARAARNNELGAAAADGSGCLYHGDDGRHCIVGHLLPQTIHDAIDEHMWNDGPRIGDLLDTELCGPITDALGAHGVNRDVACALQDLHDGYYHKPDELADALELIAQGYSLGYAPYVVNNPHRRITVLPNTLGEAA